MADLQMMSTLGGNRCYLQISSNTIREARGPRTGSKSNCYHLPRSEFGDYRTALHPPEASQSTERTELLPSKDIMADGDRDIFVYRGGRSPLHVTHVRIDKSVEVDTHDGIRKVGEGAFNCCVSLRSIDLRSVDEIGDRAFDGCENLVDVFGDKLETIGKWAFDGCTSLERLKLPSIITVRSDAFQFCKAALSSIEFSERLETIDPGAFYGCDRLQRIAIPLKRDLFPFDPELQEYTQFDDCDQLTTVDLVGGAHNKTVASLYMESWRTEMIEEINRINQILPNTPADEKTAAIRQWVDSVINRIDHYKAEHHRYVKEAITLLELALWKAKLAEKEENAAEGRTKKVKLDAKSVRKEKRITCGADTVMKNVHPFLQLE
eukprot:scaffold5588_cov78-Skeletonema_dohrnii-CCMP3373.AAC.2